MSRQDWTQKLKRAVALAKPGSPVDDYIDANVATVMQVARGLGPDAAASAAPNAGAGLRIVFNIACKHVKSFCQASGAAYENAYKGKAPSPKRRQVDLAVEAAAGQWDGRSLAPNDICFGAVESSGSGIRFYGDMCLVLKSRPDFASDPPCERSSSGGDPLLVLDRNSYDVARDPIAGAFQGMVGANMTAAQGGQILQWMGSWEDDLLKLCAARVLEELPHLERRWTTGQISLSLLSDEDYIEVLYPKSFNAGDLLEVRLSAADVAAEADIANREAAGEATSPEEGLWRAQRREARRALAKAAVPVRVVLTPGRIKSA